jgi:hypothetical protein
LEKFKYEFANEFKKRVEQRTPVITGRLRAAWTVMPDPQGFIIKNDTPYAAHVEYGTDVMSPRAMVGTTVMERQQIAAVAIRRVGL